MRLDEAIIALTKAVEANTAAINKLLASGGPTPAPAPAPAAAPAKPTVKEALHEAVLRIGAPRVKALLVERFGVERASLVPAERQDELLAALESAQ